MSRNHEWLELVEVSGPFLALPVLREAFPQGLEELDCLRAKRLRSAYEEWRDAVDSEDSDLGRLHEAWIEEVLRTALEVDDELLRRGDRIPSAARMDMPEHDTAIGPDLALVDPARSDALLVPVHVFSPDADLVASMRFGGLSCSPADRMAMYLRAVGCPLGVVTNGERWMVVHAPVGQMSTFASWYARLWGQEPDTLRAFASLLGVRRLFGLEQDRLPSLFARSLKHQDEVTEALGEQVRRAVEVLVQALDRADQDRNRELLRDVKPQELYEAGLTVMMRLVFLLAAEERGLLLLGEPRYDAFYAVSTLRMQLRAENEEILERRRSAWSRLLAVFRAVFGGIDHPTLHLPAMGGSLFDPDRFPFLEGRSKGSSWRHHPAAPLPIDDRTVLLLLDAIQTFEGRTLLYRALDVEQIGHVYEGLLERTVKRVDDVTLELEGSAQAKDPRVTLGELESARLEGDDAVVSLFVERTRRSESSIRNSLAREVEARLGARLLTACRGDVALRDRLEPYAWLLRTDPWGYPLVHPEGAFVVVMGIDRRETGTHYTPKSLTEKIVEETLTPLVYDGPAKGAPRESWTLKSPAELLDLKICDPAMGSGAFLVQVCRFLAARLVEAWSVEEDRGRVVDVQGRVHDSLAESDPLPQSPEARAETARRLVAERCLYGVDINPLAVELAKLSLWLVTLAKGRPFGFLDHNLRCGDSLLGISSLEQLTELSIAPKEQTQGRLFGKNVRQAVEQALAIRLQLRELPIRDIRDVDAMAILDAAARKRLRVTLELADAFIANVLAAKNDLDLESRLAGFAVEADQIVRGATEGARPTGGAPFHWPLEFPEAFSPKQRGFDAVLGNPPYAFGEIRPRVARVAFGLVAGQWDLCWLFVERSAALISDSGHLGVVLPDAILARSEPSAVRRFILSQFRSVCVDHVGAVFRAGVSVFALVGHRQSAAEDSTDDYGVLWYRAPGHDPRRLPGALIADGRHPWNAPVPDQEAGPHVASWKCLGDVALIGRGEEVGKKDLAPLEANSAVASGSIAVLAGAGVTDLITQPIATHQMPKRLVKKKNDQYRSPKIVVVKTGSAIRAGIDRQSLVTLQSVYNIHVRPGCGFRLEFIAAVLACKAANERFILPFTQGKKLFPQITQQMLKDVRLPPASQAEQDLIVDYLERGQLELVDVMVSTLFTGRRIQ